MKMRILPLIFCLCSFAWSQTPIEDKTIEKILEGLRDENVYQRQWTVNQLVSIGEPVVSVIIKNYARQNFRVRREMVEILGKIDSLPARRQLLKCLCDIDQGVRNRTSLVLLKLCTHNPQLVKDIRAIRHPNPQIRTDIEILLQTLLYYKVERELAKLISEQGGFGFYEGQFASLVDIGNHVVAPLLEIFTKDEYRFVNLAYEKDGEFAWKIRILAGEALADCHIYIKEVKKNKKIAKKISSTLRKLLHHKNESIKEIAMFTLYMLDYRAPLQKKIDQFQSKIKEIEARIAKARKAWSFLKNSRQHLAFLHENLAIQYNELAMIYLRIDNDQKAVRLLKKVLENDPFHTLAYYNLACVYSTMKNIEKAAQALQKAIDNGYDDLGWIYKDGDLKNLRNAPQFKKIEQNLRKRLQGW